MLVGLLVEPPLDELEAGNLSPASTLDKRPWLNGKDSPEIGVIASPFGQPPSPRPDAPEYLKGSFSCFQDNCQDSFMGNGLIQVEGMHA
jgi:hypothetical protein